MQPISLKTLAPSLGRLPPIVRQLGLHRRRGQGRLERDEGGNIAGGHGVGHAAFGEVVAARPPDAETFDRLHAMVDVEGVDGELAQRGEHALAAEWPDDKVGVDAIDRVEIDHAVWMRDDPAEPYLLRDKIGARVLPAGAGFSDRCGADRLQVRGHLARQQLDQPRAH